MNTSRRAFLATSFSAGLTSALAFAAVPAFALTDAEANRLVARLVADINKTINSGGSVNRMIGDFEKIFIRYADVPTIARSALGPQARSASASQLRAYTGVFQGYIARKYGRRFNEFKGGTVTVRNAVNRGKFFEVNTVADLPGQAPFGVVFRVSDRSGKDLFFDMIVEGISLLSTERVEIGAMLDRRKGDIGALTQDLKRAG